MRMKAVIQHTTGSLPGCFGLVQAFALFLARRAPTALASSLYSCAAERKGTNDLRDELDDNEGTQ